jgi:FKBP-type peptidyl-prolyl cis-trans isomerase
MSVDPTSFLSIFQVIDMSLGECAKIHCSPDYAYGAGGFPAWGIQPNSELIFEIEVLSFK